MAYPLLAKDSKAAERTATFTEPSLSSKKAPWLNEVSILA